MADEKYIAFRIKGLKYWIWFEQYKVHFENGQYECKEGWGKNGAYIERAEFNPEDILGKMITKELQY